MSLADDFQAAVDRMNAASAPGQSEQLKLYGLFKQATKGDPTDKRPGMTKIRERAKFDAWAANKGMSKDAAMQKYIELVGTLA
jgi:acyl-CoA-binding protein